MDRKGINWLVFKPPSRQQKINIQEDRVMWMIANYLPKSHPQFGRCNRWSWGRGHLCDRARWAASAPAEVCAVIGHGALFPLPGAGAVAPVSGHCLLNNTRLTVFALRYRLSANSGLRPPRECYCPPPAATAEPNHGKISPVMVL